MDLDEINSKLDDNRKLNYWRQKAAWAIDPDRCGLCNQHSNATPENRRTALDPFGHMRCDGHAFAAWQWEYR